MKEETQNYIVTTKIAVSPKCTQTALSPHMPLVIITSGVMWCYIDPIRLVK